MERLTTMETKLPTTDKTCGKCASLRGADGYCKSKGIYVHAWDERQCFHEPEPEPELPTMLERKPQKMKTCKQCGRTLPIDEFPRHNTSRDGHDGLCMDCKRKQMTAAQAERDKMRLERIGMSASGEVLPEGMRRCTKCRRVLPVSEFGICKKNKDGIQYECKDCRNEYGRALYHSRFGGSEVPMRQRTLPKDDPKPVGGLTAMTDAQMVETLRAHGWTVVCTRKVEEAL
jgi:hypothetical protein